MGWQEQKRFYRKNARNRLKGSQGTMAQGLNYRLFQASLVLLADDVHAGGVNPDYLAVKGIVPEEWAWEVSSNTMAAPTASMVTYENGTKLLAQAGRFQSSHDEEGFDPIEKNLDFIANKYVQANPDLHYSIIAANFHAAIFDPEAQSFLKSTLIRDENTARLGFDEVRIVEVLANKDDKKIAFHFNTGAATEEEDEKLVLLVRGNFERNCSGYPASEQACEFVSKFKDDWKEYQGLLNKFFIQE